MLSYGACRNTSSELSEGALASQDMPLRGTLDLVSTEGLLTGVFGVPVGGESIPHYSYGATR